MHTESDRQAGPVSQNQIRKCEQNIQFCGLFSQTSVSCCSETQLLLYNSKNMFNSSADGRFLAFSTSYLGLGTSGVVFTLRRSAVNFVADSLSCFIIGNGLWAFLSTKITAVTMDSIFFAGQQFSCDCHIMNIC